MAIEKLATKKTEQNLYSGVFSSPAPANPQAVLRAAAVEQERACRPKAYRWTDADLADIRKCKQIAMRRANRRKITEIDALREAIAFFIQANEGSQP